jgi:hypothetical protein
MGCCTSKPELNEHGKYIISGFTGDNSVLWIYDENKCLTRVLEITLVHCKVCKSDTVLCFHEERQYTDYLVEQLDTRSRPILLNYVRTYYTQDKPLTDLLENQNLHCPIKTTIERDDKGRYIEKHFDEHGKRIWMKIIPYTFQFTALKKIGEFLPWILKDLEEQVLLEEFTV